MTFMQISSVNSILDNDALLFQELFVLSDAQSYHLWQILSHLQ